ncbi:NAD(P)H-dependent oxidoreductase [Aeromicrobium sp. CnD17-E]|uniref:flavodoxin family protein n=1 Tax=Aeromicrobium sp. CnD17-E TaxID=2954487 RepID=UPI002097FBCE|nr:NAD(P)H-dependent oxidoreductase [Aeromicrobium sp. CnD17-E]MCO7239676.1 NAD(P)H-dependent oxidoreductase [Aeromicrobium sp. CnD17-E]
MTLTALALNCTLKRGDAPSSSALMAQQYLDALAEHDVVGTALRVVDLDVRPGVETDMGDGDEWPAIRRQVLDADVLVVVTPTWVGQMSSVANRVLERLDAELSETRDDGNPILYGKVALVGVVGNEDGAHKITADLYQALDDCGLTIPAQGGTYWNGEAMHTVDYHDLDEAPEATLSTLRTAAANAVHLARLLSREPYPA